MKQITECFESSASLKSVLQEAFMSDENIEKTKRFGKAFFNAAKKAAKKVFNYLWGFVMHVGTYFIPLDEDKKPMNAISPLTAGQAYKDGVADRNNTFVALDDEGADIVGLHEALHTAENLYGKGSTLDYYNSLISESMVDIDDVINEVKLQNQDPEAKYNVIVDDNLLGKMIYNSIKGKQARLMIWGAPGIGKTAILMNVLNTYDDLKGYNLICKTLSNETPDNFTLPKYVEIDGEEKATDVPKTWLPVYKPSGDPEKDKKLSDACGKGLLFLDELSRATPQVLNVILPLVNEGQFNGYKLGAGWSIVCASNRMEDEMSGQTDIGAALGNRFQHIYYEPTVNTWKKWASKQKYISPLLITWLSMPDNETIAGGKYFYMDPNEEIEDGSSTRLMCTPRSWDNAMRDLAVWADGAFEGDLSGSRLLTALDRNILKMILNKYVPASAVDSFCAFLSVIDSISGDFDTAMKFVWKKGKLNVDKKAYDKGVAIPLAQLVCCAHADSLPTEDEFNNVCKWIVDQNNASLASYFIDNFIETFIGKAFQTRQDQCSIFMISQHIAKHGSDKAFMKDLEYRYKPWLALWKLKKLEQAPNWFTGFQTLATKYKSTFKALSFNGVDLLG